jgi:2-polyprenyl-3-methyl-5-hydroxy-6-metoxy-1,4-benzoquinol methylase
MMFPEPLKGAIPIGKKASRTGPETLRILQKELNHYPFTGERIVINQEVCQNHRFAMEEHLLRYEFASTLVQEKQVLDAACGSGYGSKMMATAGAASVVGVDIDSDSIQLAQTEYPDDKIRYMTADICDLPFQTATFDMVSRSIPSNIFRTETPGSRNRGGC